MMKFRHIFIFLIPLIFNPSIASAGNMGITHDKPTTVKILTLDDRPPNLIFIKQLTAIAGIYPVITTGDEIGDQFPNLTEYDLVSLNAAVAGSLVGSRTADPWELQPPNISNAALVHFAVPRAQPTVADNIDMEKYREVMGNLDQSYFQKLVVEVIFGSSLSTGDEYLDIYANKIRGWLDFLDRAKLDPDRLLITLDDNRPGILVDKIKIELMRYSHHVMDGTDEGMMLLLARYMREHQPEAPTTLGLVWTSTGDMVDIAPAESGFVVENLLAELRWLKARVTSRNYMLDPWRPVLWINGGSAAGETKVDSIIKLSGSFTEIPVVVADIARMNGGDPELMAVWREYGPPERLVGYLAWNTSSNTLGSAVALWMAIDYGYAVRSDPVSVQAATEIFLWSRLLDDWLYQTIVRGEVRSEYASRGANIWDLTEQQAHAAASEIAPRLVELWREEGIDLSIPLRIVEPLGETGFIVELPWNRFFEIELTPTDNRGWVPQVAPLDTYN